MGACNFGPMFEKKTWDSTAWPHLSYMAGVKFMPAGFAGFPQQLPPQWYQPLQANQAGEASDLSRLVISIYQ